MYFRNSVLGCLRLLFNLFLLIPRVTPDHIHPFLIWITCVRKDAASPKLLCGSNAKDELPQLMRLQLILNSSLSENKIKNVDPMSVPKEYKVPKATISFPASAPTPSSPSVSPSPSSSSPSASLHFSSKVHLSSQHGQKNLFFGSGFIPLKALPSTTHTSVRVRTCDRNRFPKSDLVLRLVDESQANIYNRLYDILDGFVVRTHTSGCFVPIYQRELIGKENQTSTYFICTPKYPSNLNDYLSCRKVSINEGKHLMLFLLAVGLKLHEVQIGFQKNRFSFDYVFLKDADKGICFDNLVLGGYHAMEFFDTNSTSPLHPSFSQYTDSIIKMVKEICVQPVAFSLWILPFFEAKDYITSLDEARMIFDMIAVG